MAARARIPLRPAVAGILVAIALIIASCSSHDTQPEEQRAAARPTTTSRPEPPADARLREIAGEIGCSATTPVDGGVAFTAVVVCETGGRTDTRIQRFEPSERASVERRFSETFGDPPGGGVECDGHTYRYVVLGDDWLVATDERAVAGDLVVHLRAAFVGPDGNPGQAHEAPDVCR